MGKAKPPDTVQTQKLSDAIIGNCRFVKEVTRRLLSVVTRGSRELDLLDAIEKYPYMLNSYYLLVSRLHYHVVTSALFTSTLYLAT